MLASHGSAITYLHGQLCALATQKLEQLRDGDPHAPHPDWRETPLRTGQIVMTHEKMSLQRTTTGGSSAPLQVINSLYGLGLPAGEAERRATVIDVIRKLRFAGFVGDGVPQEREGLFTILSSGAVNVRVVDAEVRFGDALVVDVDMETGVFVLRPIVSLVHETLVTGALEADDDGAEDFHEVDEATKALYRTFLREDVPNGGYVKRGSISTETIGGVVPYVLSGHFEGMRAACRSMCHARKTSRKEATVLLL